MYVLIPFNSTNVFYALSCLLARPGFRLFCSRFAVCYLAIYSVSGTMVKQTNGNECNGCVSVRVNLQ